MSVVPDVCLTPQGAEMVPIPPTIWCRQADAGNLANSVRQTDDRSHAKASLVLRCHGDEPGTGGGVVSGTTGAECTPKTWSETVFVEGRNLVRHTDDWWMNHHNTYGRLYYTKDMSQEVLAPVPEVKALVRSPGSGQDAPSDQGTRVAGGQAPATATDGPVPGAGTAGGASQGAAPAAAGVGTLVLSAAGGADGSSLVGTIGRGLLTDIEGIGAGTFGPGRRHPRADDDVDGEGRWGEGERHD